MTTNVGSSPFLAKAIPVLATGFAPYWLVRHDVRDGAGILRELPIIFGVALAAVAVSLVIQRSANGQRRDLPWLGALAVLAVQQIALILAAFS